MAGASGPVDVSAKRQRIAELARQSPEMGFTSLASFIDIDWLRQAYRLTRKDGAVDLEGNLRSLLERAKLIFYSCASVFDVTPLLMGRESHRSHNPSATPQESFSLFS
jgi:hypothetical protein